MLNRLMYILVPLITLHAMVKWELKADWGNRLDTRDGGRKGDRQHIPFPSGEKIPQTPIQSTPLPHALRGSPIAMKLAKHSMQTWSALTDPQRVIHVRPLSPTKVPSRKRQAPHLPLAHVQHPVRSHADKDASLRG